MTDDDYDALSQKQLASIKRDMRISLEDAAVRATYKVMAELETEQEPVAYQDTADKCRLETVPAKGGLLPQRTWVGLTDEEIDQGLLRTNYAMHTASAWRDGVEWATKQLKEKNT
jgi:hypothetical protein